MGVPFGLDCRGWGRSSQETISETGQDMDQGYYWWPIGNRIHAFNWCQNQRPWMTLKGHYALYFKTRSSFGAHHENLNEDRLGLYYQRRRYSPMTLNSDIRFMRIFADSQWFSRFMYIFLRFCACARILRTHVHHAFSLSSSVVLFTTVIYQWLQ